MSIINRFSNSLKAAYDTWMGIDQKPSYFNPFYYDITTPEEKRVLHLQRLFDQYNGKHTKYFNTESENITLNFSRRIVQKGVFFLFAEPIVIELNDAEIDEREIFLDKCFGSTELRQQLFIDAALNGGITGEFFIQLSIDENGIPKFDVINPLSVFPKYDPHNKNVPIEFEIRWHANDTVYRNRHVKLDNGFWYSYVEYQENNNTNWISDDELSFEWNYNFPMIVHGRNLPKPNSSSGQSDLEDADINDAINLAAGNTNKNSKMFSQPVLYGNGYDVETLDSTEILMSSSPDAKLNALQLTDSISSNVEYLKFLKGSLAEITSVPESDSEARYGASSGFALSVILNDIVLKTKIKRSLYGSAIVELCKRALIIGGFEGENSITLYWGNPLPVDKRMENESDRMDLELGIASMKTIRAKRGYNDTLEEERIAKEKPNRIS